MPVTLSPSLNLQERDRRNRDEHHGVGWIENQIQPHWRGKGQETSRMSRINCTKRHIMHGMSKADGDVRVQSIKTTRTQDRQDRFHSVGCRKRGRRRKRNITSSIFIFKSNQRRYIILTYHLINLSFQIDNPIFLYTRQTTRMSFLTIPYPLL